MIVSDISRRIFMKGCCMAAVVYGAAPKVTKAQSTEKPDAIVNQHHTGHGSQSAPPTYTTVAAALDAAPQNSHSVWTIALMPGRYREKLVITKPHLCLVGSGRSETCITFDAFAGAEKPDGTGQWGTPGSATLTINAPGFSARHLTIANEFDFIDNDRRDPQSANRIGASQAVAVFLGESADRSLFYDVGMTGYQDTLFTECGRSLFSHCAISGNVDFIFGSGTVLFDRCDIISRPRASTDTLPAGFVVAPSTSKHSPFGLIFHHCHLKKESADQPAASHYLGRPWHPTRSFADGRYADPDAVGNAVFLQCSMEDHIAVDGWTSMSGLAKDGQRKWFQPLTEARFFEYKSSGAGSHINAHRPQLSDAEALTYTVEHILGDWRPSEKLLNL
jgi:pectinesterase